MMVSEAVAREHGSRIQAIGRERGRQIDLLPFPHVQDLDFEAAFLSKDLYGDPRPGALTELARATYDHLLAAGAMKWLQIAPAGLDMLPVCRPLLNRGVRLTTSSGALAEPIAVSAIGGLIAIARGFPRWIAAQARREWSPTPEREWPADVNGQTAVVIGMGPIGLEIARLGEALGLNVIAIRKDASRLPPHCSEVHGLSALPALAPRANWLVVACPLNDETRGCVSRAVIASLPPRAGVVNIARGAVIDEPALIEALQSGHLCGAYLDAFAREPLPADSPLWAMPNVIVSAHTSGASLGNDGRRMKIFFDNVAAYIDGRPMRNEIQAA